MSTTASEFDHVASVDAHGNLAPIVVNRLDERYPGAAATTAAIESVVADAQAAEARRGIITPETIDHAGVQAALDAAWGTARRVVAAGEYTTDQTLRVAADCDLSGLHITFTGAGPAVTVRHPDGGTATLNEGSYRLPSVTHAGKSGKGWSSVAGSVGAELTNLYSCKIDMPPKVTQFDTGVRLLGDGTGFVYNEISWNTLANNKVNIHLHAVNSGWVNENNHVSGRCFHYSDEAQKNTSGVMTGPAPGTRHVLMTAASSQFVGPNANKFRGMSLESIGATEFNADIDDGTANLFDHCRWESSFNGQGVAPRVRVNTGAENTVRGGYGARHIEVTYAGATAQRGLHIEAAPGSRLSFGDLVGAIGGWIVSNVSSATSPVLTVMTPGWEKAGQDPAKNWVVRLTGGALRFKQSTDTEARITIDNAGTIAFGPGGTLAPKAVFTASTTGIRHAVSVLPASTDLDLGGPASHQWRDVYVSRYMRIGSISLRDNNGVLECYDGTWKKVNLT